MCVIEVGSSSLSCHGFSEASASQRPPKTQTKAAPVRDCVEWTHGDFLLSDDDRDAGTADGERRVPGRGDGLERILWRKGKGAGRSAASRTCVRV